MKGENQPLEWVDYKSMTFTQCVMISMPPYFLKLICISYIPPHLLTITSKLTGIFHIIIRKLPLSQVINETLRVANIIGGVFRRANTDIHFKGTSVNPHLSIQNLLIRNTSLVCVTFAFIHHSIRLHYPEGLQNICFVPSCAPQQ